MQCEDDVTDEVIKPGLDPADGGIAIFHRKRESALHEGRAHALELAFGNAAGQDQGLSAPAECAIQRAHADVVRDQWRQLFLADFRPPRTDIPKRLRSL